MLTTNNLRQGEESGFNTIYRLCCSTFNLLDGIKDFEIRAHINKEIDS